MVNPESVWMRPKEIVDGDVELTVVEPIWNVVLEVFEKRHSVTAGLSTGQLANLARLASGATLLVAEPGVTATSADTAASAAIIAHVAKRKRLRLDVGIGLGVADDFVMCTLGTPCLSIGPVGHIPMSNFVITSSHRFSRVVQRRGLFVPGCDVDS